MRGRPTTKKALVLLASMALAVLLACGVALAADIDCSGDPCLGTDENDHMDGTNEPEVVRARGGNDAIDGLDGGDTLYGGAGDDKDFDNFSAGIFGGNGDDTYYGGPGEDFLSEYDFTGHNSCTGGGDPPTSCAGSDTQRGGAGFDWMEAADGRDFLYGNEGWDSMFGDSGDDLLIGGPGEDLMQGEEGSDRLAGSRGDDQIHAETGETAGSVDKVNCGAGDDIVTANRNDAVRANCEEVRRVPNPADTALRGSAGSSDSPDADREKAREEFLAND